VPSQGCLWARPCQRKGNHCYEFKAKRATCAGDSCEGGVLALLGQAIARTGAQLCTTPPSNIHTLKLNMACDRMLFQQCYAVDQCSYLSHSAGGISLCFGTKGVAAFPPRSHGPRTLHPPPPNPRGLSPPDPPPPSLSCTLPLPHATSPSHAHKSTSRFSGKAESGRGKGESVMQQKPRDF
jgi:hypothetical protein